MASSANGHLRGGGLNVAMGDGSVRVLREALTGCLSRPISEVGLKQALRGEIVANDSDRRALAELLQLMAEPRTLVSLLLPAVQRIRAYGPG